MTNEVLAPVKRLREIDFLRGVAIMLVLFSHQQRFTIAKNVGWIGVDLFFVISGFLVSGLLFKEYKTFGTIKPVHFLIRRGFKIYPIYYIFYIPYLIPIFIMGDFQPIGFLADMTFTQNYVWGVGYAYAPSWSLAVEEHFYFILTFSICFVCTYYRRSSILNPIHDNSLGKFELTIITLMILCLAVRLYTNIEYPELAVPTYTMSHLRMDSLLSGVLIAYLYHFKPLYLKNKLESNKRLLMIMALCAISWTPFAGEHHYWFFAKTIGFTLLYFAFSVLFSTIILTPTINAKLDNMFSKRIVNIISNIGRCSYSIYVIHFFVIQRIEDVFVSNGLSTNSVIIVLLNFTCSIFIGILMTEKVERFFLKVRDKYFPSRVQIGAAVT